MPAIQTGRPQLRSWTTHSHRPYTYAWLTPKGTIAVYDHREQELYTYDEYDAFADDEGVDERLRADVADALGKKYVEELDI